MDRSLGAETGMEVRKAYKVRVYPNAVQEQKLLQTVGACRWVYNYYLTLQTNAFLQTGRTLAYTDLARDLTKMRNSGEYPWLREVQSAPIQQVLRRLDTAYSRFYRKQASPPRFHTRRDARQSFTKPKDWRMAGDRITVQTDLRLKYRGTPPPDTTVLGSITVSVTTTGKWYVSIGVTECVEVPAERTSPVGVDLGLTHTAITSDGKKFDNLKLAKKRAKHLKYLQQSLARKQRDSNRRAKAKLEVSRLYEKIANQRMNHLHQVSNAITSKNHALIAVEDLAIANMVKNRSLARSISDVAWGELLRQLEYKQSWRGGEFVKVNRWFPSSKRCSSCYRLKDQMSLSERVWTCGGCGVVHDRDINAAKNILKQAEAQLGVESTDGSRKVRVTGSVKRGCAYA